MRTPTTPSPPPDDGFSLIEVLIAVVILGIAVPGLLSGLAAAALTSSVHRGQADAHLVVVSAAEAVRDEARNPFSCTPSAYDLTAGFATALPAGWSAANVSLDATATESGYWGTGAFRTAPCSASTDLQRLTVVATSPDGREVERLTVMKRRP